MMRTEIFVNILFSRTKGYGFLRRGVRTYCAVRVRSGLSFRKESAIALIPENDAFVRIRITGTGTGNNLWQIERTFVRKNDRCLVVKEKRLDVFFCIAIKYHVGDRSTI